MPLRDLCAALSRDTYHRPGAPFLPPKGERGYIARRGHYSGYRAGRCSIGLIEFALPLHPSALPAIVPPLGFVSRLFVANYLSAVCGRPNRVTYSRMRGSRVFFFSPSQISVSRRTFAYCTCLVKSERDEVT